MKNLLTFITVFFIATTLFAQKNMPENTGHNNLSGEDFRLDYHKNGIMHKQLLEREKEHLRELEKNSRKTTYKGKANEQDSLALVALYNATDGDNWDDNTNWLTGKVADWHGITLNCNGRVIEITLISNQLTGSIPAEIGNLTSLEWLILHFNQLTGSIPAEIGNLTSLELLELSYNQLTGSIPAEISNLTDLTYLWLKYNQLTGSIPAEIGNLTNLEMLGLVSNQLTGSIPAEIGNLTSLTNLDLQDNQLTGSIPAEISNLTSLKELYLYDNQLTGSIPVEIGDLTSLTWLYLSNNQLSGSIPAEIGNLTNLECLYLWDNQFEDLPDLSALTNIICWGIKNNKFTFEDIEPNIYVGTYFYYSPQAKVGSVEHYTPNPGDNLDLTVTVGGTANTYQWYKDNSAISGAVSSTYSIINCNPTNDAGIYTCKINNTIVAGLTLESENIYVDAEVTTFEISATVNPIEGGTITGTGTYNDGATAALTATPEAGYNFVNWTENGSEVSTNETYSFTVNEDRTLIANFELQIFEISATANPNESGTITGTGTYNDGATAVLTATPETGYNFVNWTEDDIIVSLDAVYSFNVDDDRTLIANFESTVSISELENEISFTVYPNPARNIVNIQLNNIEDNNIWDIQLNMYDVNGRKININTCKINTGQIQINVSGKSAGIYYLQIISAGKFSETIKLIITE